MNRVEYDKSLSERVTEHGLLPGFMYAAMLLLGNGREAATRPVQVLATREWGQLGLTVVRFTFLTPEYEREMVAMEPMEDGIMNGFRKLAVARERPRLFHPVIEAYFKEGFLESPQALREEEPVVSRIYIEPHRARELAVAV